MFYFTLAANFCLLFLTINAENEHSLILQNGTNHRELFNEFINTHGKEYLTQDLHEKRFKIFVNNLKKAAILQKTEKGTGVYGATPFSDLSDIEFKEMRGTLKQRLRKSNLPTTKVDLNFEIPCHFDWRDKNVVTPVKNQVQCGACWAFVAVANIESQFTIKHKKLISLSEQEVIDCDEEDNGCDGGLMITAFDAISKLGGLEEEYMYPYNATNNTCTFDKSKVVVKISGGVELPQDEMKMAAWIVKHGTIAIGINDVVMQHYQKGIINPSSTLCKKDRHNIDHALLIVGFGDDKGVPYWIAKNSWGEDWGEQGYLRIYRGNNTCGITTLIPSTAVVI